VENNEEINSENVAQQDPNVIEHCKKNPHIGLEFDSLEDVKNFYKAFAKEEGFGVRTRSSKPNLCILVCSNAGQRTTDNNKNGESNTLKRYRRRCSSSRTNCMASLTASKARKRHRWAIIGFNNVHNHGMVSPKSVNYLRCHKKMSTAAKSLVETFDKEGLPTGKVAAMFNNGGSTFSNRDCWNHLRDLRSRNLDVGDAQAVFNFCIQKQTENPNFFYAIQCDNDSRMINFFWVDARSRLAYKIFGDVVTFDTTYKTNKYSMPFAPFTGLNHHHQSILFGCALLQDETEKSFTWLFENWLKAMGGKSPVSIITDQDLAMRAAISKVFPQTRHRLCLWHIRKKFPEKLSHVYHKNSTFKRDLKRCIRDSSCIKDFEEDWQHIMVEYDLVKNEWLQGLYKIRESWIPVYNRNTFFAGMNTTQRSESINAFFDSFVDSSTTLQDFVVKFDKAVDSRYENEKKEDFESRHRERILSIGSKIEEHAASFYTRTIFNKFQDELAKVCRFTREKVVKSGSQYTYKVANGYDSRDSFTVSVDLDTRDAKCGCQLLNLWGYCVGTSW
jgi:hypothetical protein